MVDIAPIPSISISKEPTAIEDGDNNILDVDETVLYTITVTNDGNIELIGVQDPVDVVKDLTGTAFTSQSVAVTYQGSSLDGLAPPANSFDGTLAVGESVMFEALLTIDQAMVDAAGVVNTASVLGYDNTGATVSDSVSTDAIEIEASPSLTVTKKADVDHVTGTDSETTTGDTIVYTITIENTGNVTLTGIAITDTMTDGAGQSLTLTSPGTFSTYTLAPGETEEIEATYTIDQSAADTGSISNTVSVVGTAPDGTEVSDDLDAPVVVDTDLTPSIDVTKSSTITYADSDAGTQLGDTINYTITVVNTGNTTLRCIDYHTITDSAGEALTLTSGPTYGGTGTFDGILDVDESVTYNATFESLSRRLMQEVCLTQRV